MLLPRGLLLLAVTSAACVLAATGATMTVPRADAQSAAAATPTSLEGSWSGSGTVTYPSGGSEAARCKASFRKQSGDRFSMNAVCATPSGKVAQTASLDRLTNNRFSGEFTNTEYGVIGMISITVRGNSLTAALTGGGATASFNLSR